MPRLDKAVSDVIACGGDTDTTGAAVGKSGIPAEWLRGLCEWPPAVPWMEGLAQRLYLSRGTGAPVRPNALPTLAIVPRNLFFFGVVMTHGFRRLLPPY